MPRRELITRLLKATALADAYGLPAEGLSPEVIVRRYPGGLPVFALVGRYGTASDDTEHAARTAQAFTESGGEVDAFARALAAQLRAWFFTAPPAIGWGTLKALSRLAVGVPPGSSGVRSAGNGPCMRAPILGALVPDDTPRLLALVDASSRLTHVDVRALEGARLVALWAAMAVRTRDRPTWTAFVEEVAVAQALRPDSPFRAQLDDIGRSLSLEEPTSRWAGAAWGVRGVSGFVGHTVPAVLHLLHQRPRTSREHEWEAAVRIAVALGGDTDTVGALVGALTALVPGTQVPPQWSTYFRDWPCSLEWLSEVGTRAADVAETGVKGKPVPVPGGFLALSVRNTMFLAVVLASGINRYVRTAVEWTAHHGGSH